MKASITKIINGQEFSRIAYVANGKTFETWYPTENLAGLNCEWSFVK